MIDERRLYQALGERLKKNRESNLPTRRRLTQSELAREVGLERTSITNIENGNQKVPLHVLYRICEVLQVSILEVLPAVADIRAAEPAGELQDLTFGGRTQSVPIALKQKIEQLINREDEHAPKN